jgi:predicted metalloprotease with PDZ domain
VPYLTDVTDLCAGGLVYRPGFDGSGHTMHGHGRQRAAALLLASMTFAVVAAGQPLTVEATPYPGTIVLRVDATDLDHKVLQVRQTLPAKPGPLQLYFPRWIPGTHAPSGDVTQLAGVKICALGQPLAWRRDPLDTHLLHTTVPAGAAALELTFQYLSPLVATSGRIAVTRDMLNVQWNNLVLYPAGHDARAITVQPTLRLPTGWGYGSALRPAALDGDTVQFQPVSLETLVDSPLFAGRHLRRIELDPPGAPRPVVLTLMADRADQLKASDAQIEAHRELVRQADRVFGSRHYAHYDFLLALSDTFGGIGLEHHQSSENGVKPTYFDDWAKRVGSRELLPHEYAHSWNGKFRRPADLTTPNFNVPMQNSLLWLYEGQTEYWGWVLAARSGLTTPAQARDRLARNAATYEARTGRAWRNLQDTTNDAIMSRRRDKDWRSWQRASGDYYGESLLMWLDADMLIREKSGGTKSLDDFARAFFGVRDGKTGPLAYRFDDIVAALNGVQPHDWAAFLRQRLDSNAAPPLDGLVRAGWHLVYADTPSDESRAADGEDRSVDLSHSLGLTLAQDGKVSQVQWGGPAFDAGVAPGVLLLAVNQRAYKAETLRAAIVANKDGSAPLELLLRDGDLFRSVRVDYRGGLRYPRLERVAGSDDRLTPMQARR